MLYSMWRRFAPFLRSQLPRRPRWARPGHPRAWRGTDHQRSRAVQLLLLLSLLPERRRPENLTVCGEHVRDARGMNEAWSVCVSTMRFFLARFVDDHDVVEEATAHGVAEHHIGAELCDGAVAERFAIAAAFASASASASLPLPLSRRASSAWTILKQAAWSRLTAANFRLK